MPQPHPRSTSPAWLALSPALAAAVAAFLACDGQLVVSSSNRQLTGAAAVTACTAFIQALADEAAQGDAAAVQALSDVLAIPEDSSSMQATQPPPRLSPHLPSARPNWGPYDPPAVGAFVAHAIRLALRAAGSVPPARTWEREVYGLLHALCNSPACTAHLTALPEVHAMVAQHIDAWLEGDGGSEGEVAAAHQKAAGAARLVSLLADHPQASAAPATSSLTQHMGRLVSAMRPCLSLSTTAQPNEVSSVATLALASRTTLHPAAAVSADAGAAVLRHALYAGPLLGVRPAALRILAAELLYAGSKDTTDAHDGKGDEGLLAVLEGQLVGHNLRDAACHLWSQRPAGSPWDALSSDLLTLSPWLISHPTVLPTPLMGGLAAAFQQAVTARLVCGDAAGAERLGQLVMSPVLRRAPPEVQRWLSQLEVPRHSEAQHGASRCLPAVDAGRLQRGPAMQGCLSDECSRPVTTPAPPSARTPACSGQACSATSCRRCGVRRVCAGQSRGCDKVEAWHGDFKEVCLRCGAAYHSTGCMKADTMCGHARCLLVVLHDAVPEAPPAPQRLLEPSLVLTLGLLLQSAGNHHVAPTVAVTSHVVAYYQLRSLPVPEHLCLAAAKFWKRCATAMPLQEEAATMLALHANIFWAMRLTGKMLDPHLAACLAGLALNHPRMRHAACSTALSALDVLGRAALHAAIRAPTSPTFLRAAAAAVSEEGWQGLAHGISRGHVTALLGAQLVAAAEATQHAIISRHALQPPVLDALGAVICNLEGSGLPAVPALCLAHLLLTIHLQGGDGCMAPLGVPLAAAPAEAAPPAVVMTAREREACGNPRKRRTLHDSAELLGQVVHALGCWLADEWFHKQDETELAVYQLASCLLNATSVWSAVLPEGAHMVRLPQLPPPPPCGDAAVEDSDSEDFAHLQRRITHALAAYSGATAAAATAAAAASSLNSGVAGLSASGAGPPAESMARELLGGRAGQSPAGGCAADLMPDWRQSGPAAAAPLLKHSPAATPARMPVPTATSTTTTSYPEAVPVPAPRQRFFEAPARPLLPQSSALAPASPPALTEAALSSAAPSSPTGQADDADVEDLLALLMGDAPPPPEAVQGCPRAAQLPTPSSSPGTGPAAGRVPQPQPPGTSSVRRQDGSTRPSTTTPVTARSVPPAATPSVPPAGITVPPTPHVPPPVPPPTVAAPSPVSHPEPPLDLCCPITLSLLVDPVVAADECVYSRAAILAWLTVSNLSPMTGQPLASQALMPCRPMFSMVRQWCQEHGVRTP